MFPAVFTPTSEVAECGETHGSVFPGSWGGSLAEPSTQWECHGGDAGMDPALAGERPTLGTRAWSPVTLLSSVFGRSRWQLPPG